MSLLRVVALRATRQCRHHDLVPSILSYSRVAKCSRASTSLFLRTLNSRHQPENGHVADTHALNSGGPRKTFVRGHVLLTSYHPLDAFRRPSFELTAFSSDQKKKCYFSSPPQHEANNTISNSNNRDLRPDVSLSAEHSPNDGKIEPSIVGSSKPDTSDASKFKSIEKKDSSMTKKAQDAVVWAIKSVVNLLAKTPGVLWFYMTHPSEFRKKLTELKEMAIKEAHHYWMGSKVSTIYI